MRVVRRPNGNVELDPTGKVPGRGAYVCGVKECVLDALKTKRLAKALRCEIPSALVDDLKNRISLLDQGKPKVIDRDECNES